MFVDLLFSFYALPLSLGRAEGKKNVDFHFEVWSFFSLDSVFLCLYSGLCGKIGVIFYIHKCFLNHLYHLQIIRYSLLDEDFSTLVYDYI